MERKSKFSIDFKLEVLDLVLKKDHVKSQVCKKFDISQTELNHWITVYQSKGVDGLISKRTNQSYPPDFKLKVLTEYKDGLLSLRELSEKYNIPRGSLISQWSKKFDTFGFVGLLSGQKGRKASMKKKRISPKDYDKLSKEELLKEMRYLSAENDFLKKLDALIQSEKNQAKRKKH
jgi:transposase